MKHFLLLLLFFSFAVTASANAIDSLKTDNDVLKFILKTDTNFSYKGNPQITVVPRDTLFKLLKCNDVARQWGIKTWQKVDFNQDGLTDLLVIVKGILAFEVCVVIDKGTNTFTMLNLSQGHGLVDVCEVAKPLMINKQQMLLFYSKMDRIKKDKGKVTVDRAPRKDTLIFKYDGFVEYNPKPDQYQISYFAVETRGCYGECPIYTLRVSADGKATYQADEFNPVKGNFKGSVSVDKLNEIKSLVNYIKIKKLQDNYRVPWTDDATAILKVGFKNGTVKEITDYGMIGTRGLSQLYYLISELRTSEKWSKAD